jgi:ribosomal protein L11 methyltransferase
VIRLAVRVSSDQAELVLAELLELAPTGVEEVQLEPGTVEYAVYGAPGELPGLPDLDAAVGDALVEISTSEIPDDWQERWREFHRPVLIYAPQPRAGEARLVPDLRVRPPWEAPAGRQAGGVEEIVIDPGQAFGTGGHASTRLCLALLLELAARERAVSALLDVGTGSGVLAIAAARLGFGPVLGLDHERESVNAARQNAAVNGVRVEIRHFDLRSQELPWLGDSTGAAHESQERTVVLANLLRPLLLELAAEMPRAPAHLVAGGLLRGEVDEVARAFTDRLGMRERERRESGEWAAVWLSAPAESPTREES